MICVAKRYSGGCGVYPERVVLYSAIMNMAAAENSSKTKKKLSQKIWLFGDFKTEYF